MIRLSRLENCVQCTVFTSHITFVIFMECYTLELHCAIADASARVQLNDSSSFLLLHVCVCECIRLYVSVNTSIDVFVCSTSWTNKWHDIKLSAIRYVWVVWVCLVVSRGIGVLVTIISPGTLPPVLLSDAHVRNNAHIRWCEKWWSRTQNLLLLSAQYCNWYYDSIFVRKRKTILNSYFSYYVSQLDQQLLRLFTALGMLVFLERAPHYWIHTLQTSTIIPWR